MNPGQVIDDIKAHPLLAILAIMLVAGIWIWSKGKGITTVANSTTPTVVTLPVDQAGNPIQPVGTTNVFNSYPTASVPPIAAVDPHIQPAPKGTSGFSDNFWIYTTSPTDTIKYINDMANWSKFGPSYFVNYRNNSAVLNSYGVDTQNFTKALPGGIKVSV